jgi:subtilisin family serine protease
MVPQSRKADKRRPAGVSRRRKRHFQFETLEARQVMSGQTPLAVLQVPTITPISSEVSYSSDSLDGQLAILEREMYWAGQQAQAAAASAASLSLQSNSVPTDPLLPMQWHLINSGQSVGNPDFQVIFGKPGEDINVVPAWERGYTGKGVVVGVFDSGIDVDHPDLKSNISKTLQYDAIDRDPSAIPRPDPFNPALAHGTAVAGIIAAVANNGIGGVGVAPGATIAPMRLIDGADPTPATNITQSIVDAFRYRIQDIDITNNSWGPALPQRGIQAAPPEALLALRDSIIFGRGGLGVIHVFSAGNSASAGSGSTGFPSPAPTLSTSSYNGFVNSRYTIGVTGVDHDGFYTNFDGTITSYPETSASVLVAAPTGSNVVINNIGDDLGLGSGIVTTDQTGANNSGTAGFNQSPEPSGQELDRDFLDDTAYTSRFNGTSASAPMVSGVIALMLEANPNLSWRDVQEILIRSARQNAPYDIPQTGLDQGAPLNFTQNTWIINQKPVFHDPDPWNASIPVDPMLRVYNPVLNPDITGSTLDMHYQPTPFQLTTGAGYTISQGKGALGEQIGYAHGVIDAEMAVLLAEQWTTKGQALPPERSFTTFVAADGVRLPGPGMDGVNLPAREIGNMASGQILVPGSLGGDAGFIAYWNEYFDANPSFGQQGDPTNTRGTPIYFSTPASNAMSVETVELRVDISGGTAAALDNLRILLVSPDGTHSELNHYYIEPGNFSQQNGNAADWLLDGQSADNGGNLIWTFSTKRSWGERSDDQVLIDPFTNEPVVNTTGLATSRGWLPGSITETLGTAIKQGWQVHFENYGGTPFNVNALEFVWHGSPIVATSQRVRGFVGIDENGDDAFNYSRVITTQGELDADPTQLRFGEIISTVDETQEAFAKNVTVTVRRTADGALVDQFVTGHDGNFYFDLVPDNYTVTVEDPLDRELKDDASTPGQFLRHFKREWQITTDWFRAWDYDETLRNEVKVNASGTPLSWTDGNGDPTRAGIRNLNFLIDPGAPAAQSVDFNGTVYADVNGDGVYNGDDINLPNVLVFGDVNRNGVRDSGEVTATTNANGQYSLTVPLAAGGAVMNVAVQRLTQWTSTNDGPGGGDSKTDGVETFFVKPGDVVNNIVFAVKPPANNIGGGGATQTGTLLGVVFDDAVNPAGVRDATEGGAAGVTVFLDNNNSGTPDAGDNITTTNEHGAFVFTNVTPGPRTVRIQVVAPLQQTMPASNAGRQLTLTGSSTISGIIFGIRNSADFDFGDLPAIYAATTLAENGARHKKGPYWLGTRIDTESNGVPSPNADADDLRAPQADEDGITFGTMTPGTNATITAVASRDNGVLQGWVDWNNDGDFNDVGERIFTNVSLTAGPNVLSFTVPAGANVAQVFARFRYGEHSLGFRPIGTPFGQAELGEVEDYQLNVAVPVTPPIFGLPADIDGDLDVDGNDFLAWQRNLGRTQATRATGDANGDGQVNSADLSEWRLDHGAGATIPAVVVPSTGDFDGNGLVDGSDFLQLQRGLGLSHPSVGAGDGNYDGAVDGLDISVWRQQFGTTSPESSAAAFAAPSSVVSAATASVGGGATAPTATRSAARPAARESFDGQALVELASRLDAQAVIAGIGWGDDGTAEAATADAAIENVAVPVQGGRDRAFDDLFGSRRRRGLPAEVELEVSDDAEGCDAAFAALADHFELPWN